MKNIQQTTFITKELFNYLQETKQVKIQEHNFIDGIVLPKNSINIFQKYNKNSIYIYDIGFNNKNKVFSISNHINKTGVNPIRNLQNQKISFYDITSIYCIDKKKSKESKIAECFGERSPDKKNINKKYIQTKTLCNHTIAAYYNNCKKIFAFVVD